VTAAPPPGSPAAGPEPAGPPRCRAARARVVAEARRLARPDPGTGERPSLRRIAAELARRGLLAPGGRPYLPGSVAAMLGPAPRRTGPVPARPAGGEADR